MPTLLLLPWQIATVLAVEKEGPAALQGVGVVQAQGMPGGASAVAALAVPATMQMS